jgi:intracellular multiplication protein IcmL
MKSSKEQPPTKQANQKGSAKAAPAKPKEMVPRPHAEDAIATRLLRDTYTRERHYFLMRVIMILGAVCVIQSGTIGYLASQPTQFRYFATDPEGHIKELLSLDRPITSMNEVLNWTTNAVTQSFTFDFANYRAQLQAAKSNFTEGGWKGFEKAMEEAGVMKQVIGNSYVTTAVPHGAPVVVAQGLADGRYAWKLQIPVIVTYQNQGKRSTQELLVTAVIVRRPMTEHPNGLGIAQIIAE